MKAIDAAIEDQRLLDQLYRERTTEVAGHKFEGCSDSDDHLSSGPWVNPDIIKPNNPRRDGKVNKHNHKDITCYG